MAFSFVVVWSFECKPCQDTGKEWHLINAGSQKTEKKNQTPMNQQWKLVLLGQLSLNTAKDRLEVILQ